MGTRLNFLGFIVRGIEVGVALVATNLIMTNLEEASYIASLFRSSSFSIFGRSCMHDARTEIQNAETVWCCIIIKSPKSMNTGLMNWAIPVNKDTSTPSWKTKVYVYPRYCNY